MDVKIWNYSGSDRKYKIGIKIGRGRGIGKNLKLFAKIRNNFICWRTVTMMVIIWGIMRTLLRIRVGLCIKSYWNVWMMVVVWECRWVRGKRRRGYPGFLNRGVIHFRKLGQEVDATLETVQANFDLIILYSI